jgi:hypothetical protein|tara:strand:- start:808 stop:1137 length:330 start_codon:yes stop_codon:yes gene_type:complete
MKSRAELLMMTKNQLETFGRTLGIELDRRLHKSKLINELVDHTKEELKTVATVSVPVVESVVAKVEEVVNTAKYGLVQQGGFWSVSEGIKEVYKSSSKKNALRFIKKRS